MATRNLPHLFTPHGPPPDKDRPHAHHHHPTYQLTKRFERSMDLAIIVLVVILAIAMVYGLVTATGHPAYFDRYWISVWHRT